MLHGASASAPVDYCIMLAHMIMVFSHQIQAMVCLGHDARDLLLVNQLVYPWG